MEQLFPSRKLTVTVEEAFKLVTPDDVSCTSAFRASGQRHSCGLKKTPRRLELRVRHELPSALVTTSARSSWVSATPAARACVGIQAEAAANTKRRRHGILGRKRRRFMFSIVAPSCHRKRFSSLLATRIWAEKAHHTVKAGPQKMRVQGSSQAQRAPS